MEKTKKEQAVDLLGLKRYYVLSSLLVRETEAIAKRRCQFWLHKVEEARKVRVQARHSSKFYESDVAQLMYMLIREGFVVAPVSRRWLVTCARRGES